MPHTKVKPYPVIIFSHGLGASRMSYSAFHVELVSYGYIIASVEHRDHSAAYTFYIKRSRTSKYDDNLRSDISQEDGDNWNMESYRHVSKMEGKLKNNLISKVPVVFSFRSLSRQHASYRNKQMNQRVEECINVLNLLEDINNGIKVKNVLQSNCHLSNFCGLLDMSKVCLAGHSFGGATMLKTLSKDKRFKVGVALDAWMIPMEMETELPPLISQPILFINSANFYTVRTLEALHRFKSSKAERKFVTIKKTNHLNQCDLPFVFPKFFLLFVGEILRGNPINHLNLMNRQIMVFLSKHLDLDCNGNFKDYIKRKSSCIKESTVSH